MGDYLCFAFLVLVLLTAVAIKAVGALFSSDRAKEAGAKAAEFGAAYLLSKIFKL